MTVRQDSTAAGRAKFEAACEALRRLVEDPAASPFALHDILIGFARTAREERVPPAEVREKLHTIAGGSPFGRAQANVDGYWFDAIKGMVATEYYRQAEQEKSKIED